MILFFFLALFCKYFLQYITSNEISNLIVSGIIYLLISVYLLIKIPFLTGLTKEEINFYYNKFTHFKIQ